LSNLSFDRSIELNLELMSYTTFLKLLREIVSRKQFPPTGTGYSRPVGEL